MFLLNRPATFVLLMMAFGILLSDVAFQPAHGLKCYQCHIMCKDKSDMGEEFTCGPEETHCLKAETKDGKFGRKCSKKIESLSCDNWDELPDPEKPGMVIKVKSCFCNTDLCNGGSISSASCLSNLNGLLILFAIISLLGVFSRGACATFRQ